MVIKNYKNKFSLIKKVLNNTNNYHSLKSTLDIKDNILINVLDNPSKYIISIYLRDLHKNNIVLSYINNFLIIDFTFEGNKKCKRTFYLKNIDITKIQNIYSFGLIYITLPKNK